MIAWTIRLGIVVAWGNSVRNAAFKFTTPQSIKEMGGSTSQSQLLTIPPYFCDGVLAYVIGRTADHFAWRMHFLIGPLLVLIAALAILFSLATPGTTYPDCNWGLFSHRLVSTLCFRDARPGWATISLPRGKGVLV